MIVYVSVIDPPGGTSFMPIFRHCRSAAAVIRRRQCGRGGKLRAALDYQKFMQMELG